MRRTRSVKEFVAWAKARKEPIFSGYGNTSSRVPSALFAEQSGVALEEVAYKDAVPAIQDLIGGRIQVTFPDVVIGESYVRSGQVRALAVTSPQRAPQFPDLEAIAETYPGFEAIAFLSFTVRKEVPVEIQRKLNGWVMEILHRPDGEQAPARDRHHAAAARLGHRQVRRLREARARAVDPVHQAREDRAAVRISAGSRGPRSPPRPESQRRSGEGRSLP